jgi:hypothetical protein
MQEIPAAGSRQEGFSNLTDEHALQQEADRIPVPADADIDESVGTFSARTQPKFVNIEGAALIFVGSEDVPSVHTFDPLPVEQNAAATRVDNSNTGSGSQDRKPHAKKPRNHLRALVVLGVEIEYA